MFSHEFSHDYEQTWHDLIEFLEQDLNVQQQKLLIQNKSENKRGMLEDITAT